jgi:hypothetical protein
VAPAVAASVAADVDSELVDVELPVVVAVEVPALGVAADELESVLVAGLSDEVPVDVEPDVSAVATPGEATTITPIPKAAANAPTRPI